MIKPSHFITKINSNARMLQMNYYKWITTQRTPNEINKENQRNLDIQMVTIYAIIVMKFMFVRST